MTLEEELVEPEPTSPSRTTEITRRPVSASSYAIAAPMMPVPTTTASAVCATQQPSMRSICQYAGARLVPHQARLVGEDDELDAVAGAELGQQVSHVGLGRGRADRQILGDLPVRHPPGDHGEDL